MRLRVILATAGLALVFAGCSSDPAPSDPTPAPSPTEATPSESSEPAAPQTSADLELAPGSVGPVAVGMNKDAAADTGLFDVDVTGGDPCEDRPLQWKSSFTGVDVLTDASGSIVSLGVTDADGPRTANGLGVGSTFGELIETYGGDLSAPEQAGYGQVGVYVRDGDDWLGFLFGDATSVDDVNNDPGFTVTFAEATRFAQPALIRDGC